MCEVFYGLSIYDSICYAIFTFLKGRPTRPRKGVTTMLLTNKKALCLFNDCKCNEHACTTCSIEFAQVIVEDISTVQADIIGLALRSLRTAYGLANTKHMNLQELFDGLDTMSFEHIHDSAISKFACPVCHNYSTGGADCPKCNRFTGFCCLCYEDKEIGTVCAICAKAEPKFPATGNVML